MTTVAGAEILPGADSHLNANRWQDVRAVILHEPQGGCEGVIGLGRSRHHSTPGTFNGVDCRNGWLVQHYPDEVRCTHAAGANAGGPGWEGSDTTGAAYSHDNLVRLGQIIVHYNRVHGVPLVYFENPSGGVGGRIWVDRSSVRGFVAHRAVDYPPDRSFLHYDGPTTAEFQRAIALAGGAAPQPVPAPPAIPIESGDLGMDGIFHSGQWHWFSVRDDGALIERYGGGDNPNKTNVIMPSGWCRPGPAARVKVVDPNPRDAAAGYAVAALRTQGDICNVAVWRNEQGWALRGWPS